MESSNKTADARIVSSRKSVARLLRVSVLLWSFAAFATPPPKGIAPVTMPTGGFAIDGDLMANTPGANTGDWLATTNGTGGGVLSAAGVPLDPTRTFHFIDPYNSGSDNTFVGGLKWTDNPNSWQWTTGKPSSKTDINNVLLHISSDTNGHTWTIIAADRASTSGDSYIDFEFLQSPLVKSNNGSFISSGLNGGRTTNDLLLSLAFDSGGSVADFLAYRWSPNGSGGFGYVDVTASLPTGHVFVALNTNSIPVPYGAFGSTTYSPNAFVEAALDMTAMIGNFDPCVSFGFKTIMVKTKSSSSSTATIEDFIDPIQYNFKIGPSADPGTNQARCTQGAVTDFPLHGVATAGLQPVASTAWSVVSGSAIIDAPALLDTTAHVSSASAVLRLTVVELTGCTETNDVLLTVKPLSPCLITGPATVCPRSSTIFTGPAAMTSYSWLVSGNGTISGATNARTVTIVGGSICGTNFTVNLICSSNGCPGICSMDVLVNDTNAPSITCPADAVLECPAAPVTNVTGVATAQDDCGIASITFSDQVTTNCGNTRLIARTWTAIDFCGNSSSCVQNITVRDTTPPVITCPANVTLECPASPVTNVTGVATATDGCGPVSIGYSDSISNSCGGSSVISRIWTATDACGNSRSCVQTITIRDTTPPTITAPANVTLECPATTTTNATGVATASDTCSSVSISYNDVVTTNCGGTKVIARTWKATDSCGNNSTAVQTITVRDTTPPTITAPADVTLECPAVTTTNATGLATASDGCGSVTVSYSDVTATNCGGSKVISRTWAAADQCGNRASAVQTITVRDTTKPTLTLPADVVLECPATNTGTNVTGAATAQDTCSAVTIGYSDAVTTNCGLTKVIARTWTATDQCGNSISGVQTITVRDTTPPTITCPTNITLECPALPVTNVTGVATASDGCGAVSISYSDSVSNSCGGSSVISRTWTATDACGNSRSCTQTITIRDTTPPTITAPANMTLECPATTTTNATGVATASDTCGSVTISYSDVVTNNCGGTKVISRTWKATDSCGNNSSALQTITVRDTTAPTITAPTDVTLECPATTTTNATGVATASDGCGSVTINYGDVVATNCGGTKVISRTWTATDQCGNHSSAVQTITVRDTTKPTLTLPANVVLECPATNTGTNATGVATAQDTCSAVTIGYSDVVTTNCGATKVIARTWTATDQCGNSISGVQTITVRDTTPPTITAPANLVLECPAVTTTNATGVATGSDGCSVVTISYSDSVSNSCAGAKVITRTWTATDACGNHSSAVQTITVRDTTPPTITAPVNLTIECGTATTTNVTGMATGTDGCGSVSFSYSDSVSNNCGGSRVITRNWTATDQCGNSASALQVITVRDTTPPSLRLPANVTLQCPSATTTNVTGVPTVTDACSAVTLSFSDVVSNSCGQTKTVWRTWVAADQCGNTTNGVQTIAVVDTTKPSISIPNISVQCVGDIPAAYTNFAAFQAAGGTATDSCSAPLTFALMSDSGLVGHCPGHVTRVYRATDVCGNYGEVTHTITVDDTIPPVLTCASNVTVECGTSLLPANTGLSTATDNCSTNVTVTYSDVQLGSSYTVNFYAADPSPNSGPYAPTYIKLAPSSLPCAAINGRAQDPLRNAVAFGPTSTSLDALTSASGVTLYLGQVVPYEAVITMSGAPGPERGTIEFTVDWATYTTSNDRFGFDTNYMVYCAFVDTADPGTIDPNQNARVESVTSRLVNQGTVGEQIEGTFRVSGLDAGDQIVVEMWLVLDSTTPGHTGGSIAAQLVSAAKFLPTPEPISIGGKTISINANKVDPLPAPQPQPPLGTLPQQPPVPPGRLISVINRTWTATDDCGNQSACVQQINVQDTAAPVLTMPLNIVLECPADTSTNATGVPVAQDACGTVVALSYSDVVSNGCGGTKTISRTWTTTDDSGNTTNVVQTITVRDTTPPNIVAPKAVVLECPAVTTTNVTGVATATDGCGSVSISYSDSVTTNCGSARTISRTWTATDQCGNTSSAIQVISVQDTTKPSLTIPPDLAVECPASSDTNTTGSATGQDTCGSVTISYSDTVTPGIGTNIIARTWTATDACGNTASAVQHIIVRDSVAPQISARLVNTLSSADYSTGGSATDLLQANFATVFPNGITIGVVQSISDLGSAHGLTWQPSIAGVAALQTTLSQCGGTAGAITQNGMNTSDTSGGGGLACQTLALTLNIGFNAAGVLGTGPNNFGSLIYNNIGDSLDGMTIAQILTVANHALAGLGLPSGYTFDSLAALLNSLNLSFQNYALSSIAAMNLSAPALAVQCAGQVPAPNAATVSASDSCSTVTVSSLPDAISSYTCANQYTIMRTWVAHDASGNTNTCSYYILVNDTTPPTLTAQPDRTVSSGQAWSFDEPTASDNCGSVTVHILSTLTNVLSPTSRTFTRTWQATDACGNTSTAQQTIADNENDPQLTFQFIENGIVLTWPAPYILQWSIALAGPYADVPGATSPYFYDTATSPQRFFRLVAPSSVPVITSQPQSQTLGYGDNLSLNVGVNGATPLSYQWQLNGASISGATNNSLSITGVQYNDAGLYTVLVSNGNGSAMSSPAIVNVVSKLLSQISGGGLTLTWSGPFILQWSGNPAGPYTDVPVATSPYTYNGPTQKFFRLRSQGFSLISSKLPAGKFSVSGPGVPGCNFVIQSSTDLINWQNMQTNPSPCLFIDDFAWQYPTRFYRAVLAH